MENSKTFRNTGKITAESVGKAVKDYLQTEKKMLTMGGITKSGSYLIQAKELSGVVGALNFLGYDKALLIQILPKGTDELTVKLGQGKWGDNWLPLAMRFTLFPFPAVVGAAIGVYNQYSIADDIFACIEKLIKSGGNSC